MAADGPDIGRATSSTCSPVSGDVDKAISVRVSFTDDAGNAESLASAATTAVVSAVSPLVNLPSGTAALAGLTVNPYVGETTKLVVSWTAFSGVEKYLVQAIYPHPSNSTEEGPA